jgi:CHAD domain-containing protein
MKKNEMEQIISLHFKKIDILFSKIIAGFEIEAIHNFRTEIKKLRSFLHLLDFEVDGGPLKITEKLKTFYRYIGEIRNLQLHYQNVENYFKNSNDEAPGLYIPKLNSEIGYLQNTTKEFISSHNNFLDDVEKMVSQLPGKLRKSSIKKFIKYVVYEIQVLLIRLNNDEALHSIRKFLKNHLYNWKFVQPYMVKLSPGFNHEEEIRTIIEMLGNFRNKCIDPTLLKTYCDACQDKDKPVLQNLSISGRFKKKVVNK